MAKLSLYFGADHRGAPLKTALLLGLAGDKYDIHDLGTNSQESCDASDFAAKLAAEMRYDPEARGVLICGTGQAMAMTANRYRHVRAALCLNTTMARLAREHNDANILVLGAYLTGEGLARECLETFLQTPFLQGRYVPRRDKLINLGGL